MKIQLYIFACVVLVTISGCQSKTSPNKNTHTEHQDSSSNSTTGNGESHTEHILKTYLEIKDALVKSDGTAASKAANDMVAMLGDETDATLKQIKVDAGHIAGTHDLEHQRGHFPSLSEQVYKLVKNGNLNGTLYWDFCPMANDGKGAYWLSNEKEIKNPYFGDKMLKCGSVKETVGE